MPPQKQCCCATLELSIEIYRDAYYADLHNRRGYAYYILYINMYIPCGLLWDLWE